jgi:hypothetical protein
MVGDDPDRHYFGNSLFTCSTAPMGFLKLSRFLFINGEEITSHFTFDLIDPGTGKVVFKASGTTPKHLSEAIWRAIWKDYNCSKIQTAP